jgi:hypothetical protein
MAHQPESWVLWCKMKELKAGHLGSLALRLASVGWVPLPPTPSTPLSPVGWVPLPPTPSTPLSPVTHHSLQPSCKRSPGARVTLAPSPEICQQLHCSGRMQLPACSSRPCAEGKIRTSWGCEGTTVTYVPCTMLASCSALMCGDKVGRCSQHRSNVLPTGKHPREGSREGRLRGGGCWAEHSLLECLTIF